jgi:hypothetical protein
MKINFSDMTKMIGQAVATALVPAIRKIVKEEVARGVRRVIKENRNLIESAEYSIPSTITEDASPAAVAKEELAKRAHSRASEIISKSLKADDPYADLIMSAEDPVIEEQNKARQYDDLPMVEITNPDSGTAGIQPEQIDYSAMIDKMDA